MASTSSKRSAWKTTRSLSIIATFDGGVVFRVSMCPSCTAYLRNFPPNNPLSFRSVATSTSWPLPTSFDRPLSSQSMRSWAALDRLAGSSLSPGLFQKGALAKTDPPLILPRLIQSTVHHLKHSGSASSAIPASSSFFLMSISAHHVCCPDRMKSFPSEEQNSGWSAEGTDGTVYELEMHRCRQTGQTRKKNARHTRILVADKVSRATQICVEVVPALPLFLSLVNCKRIEADLHTLRFQTTLQVKLCVLSCRIHHFLPSFLPLSALRNALVCHRGSRPLLGPWRGPLRGQGP